MSEEVSFCRSEDGGRSVEGQNTAFVGETGEQELEWPQAKLLLCSTLLLIAFVLLLAALFLIATALLLATLLLIAVPTQT